VDDGVKFCKEEYGKKKKKKKQKEKRSWTPGRVYTV
jgi:hypothetical protein